MNRQSAVISCCGLAIVRKAKPGTQTMSNRSRVALFVPDRTPIVETRICMSGFTSFLLFDTSQSECAHEEHSHLVTGHRRFGAVVATTTTGRDALGRQLLDPVHRPVTQRHIAEDAGGRRW